MGLLVALLLQIAAGPPPPVSPVALPPAPLTPSEWGPSGWAILLYALIACFSAWRSWRGEVAAREAAKAATATTVTATATHQAVTTTAAQVDIIEANTNGTVTALNKERAELAETLKALTDKTILELTADRDSLLAKVAEMQVELLKRADASTPALAPGRRRDDAVKVEVVNNPLVTKPVERSS
jgi:hypothetical protein